MSIKKLDDGRYEVDIRPQGRNGKRFRRRFDKKHEAAAYEKYVAVNYHDKEWLSKPADKRPLSDLIELWWLYHGQNVKHGKLDKAKLEFICNLMDDPCSFQIDSLAITKFKSLRLAKGVKATTVNRNLMLLSGLFTYLNEAGLFHAENPLHGVTLLKGQLSSMTFMSADEIEKLLSVLEGDNKRIAILSLSTGGRWGEISSLKVENVINNRVTFLNTKNGKPRTVPISDEVFKAVKNQKSGLLFPDADYLTFRLLLKSVKPDLPKGQSLHVLRHTFATHFMMNGGNIITLQRILGHANINQTMVYAHFAPDFLQDAISFNPLRGKAGLECPHSVHT